MYSEQTATSILDVPALIAAFASARGWTVVGTTLTRPGGGRSFEITAAVQGTNNREHRIYVKDTLEPAGRSTWTQLPWVNGTNGNPVVLAPTKVHLFGNDDPWDEEPWIAIVIECGFNSYRHIYIGNVVKIGDYTGGEIICSNFYGSASFDNQIYFDSTTHKYMFSARHNVTAPTGDEPGGAHCGGVNIVHADNANPWRFFDAHSSSPTQFNGNEVFGGTTDNINGGLVRRGLADYAAASILVPVNLYVPDSAAFGADVRFRPIGHLPGVRMINMESLEPGSAISVAGANWRVFPEFAKRESPVAMGAGGGYYWPYETSYMLGLAYPE